MTEKRGQRGNTFTDTLNSILLGCRGGFQTWQLAIQWCQQHEEEENDRVGKMKLILNYDVCPDNLPWLDVVIPKLTKMSTLGNCVLLLVRHQGMNVFLLPSSFFYLRKPFTSGASPYLSHPELWICNEFNSTALNQEKSQFGSSVGVLNKDSS